MEVVPVAVRFARGVQALLDKTQRHVQEEVQVRFRNPEILVFRAENPFAQRFRFLCIGGLGALVGDIGIDIPVQQDGFSGGERFADGVSSPPAVLGVQQGHQLRMHGVDGAEASAEKLADEVAVHRRVIAREMDVLQAAKPLQVFPEAADLRGFARAVQTFQDD